MLGTLCQRQRYSGKPWKDAIIQTAKELGFGYNKIDK